MNMNIMLIHVLATSSAFYSKLSDNSLSVGSQILPGFYGEHAVENYALNASVDYISLSDPALFHTGIPDAASITDYSSLHDILSRDLQLFHMTQRSIYNKNLIGSNLLLFTRYALGVLKYIRSKDISSVIFGVAPHSVLDYIWLIVSRYFNINAFIFDSHTYLSGRCNLFDSSFSLMINPNPLDHHLKKLSNSLSDLFLSSGRPLDLKNIPDPITRDNFSQWKNSTPQLLSSFQRSNPYVVFFLAFEPEASTNPMGGKFFEQRFAVEYLRVLLPPHFHIYIKDHPWYTENNCEAPYMNVVNPHSFRKSDFYDSLSCLPNVSFISSEIKDPDALICSSLATSSLNGTVTFDSIMRGIPAINFGHSGFEGLPGVIKSENINSFNCLDLIKRGYSELLNSEHSQIISDYLRSSFPGDPYGPCSEVKNLTNSDERLQNELDLADTISSILSI